MRALLFLFLCLNASAFEFYGHPGEPLKWHGCDITYSSDIRGSARIKAVEKCFRQWSEASKTLSFRRVESGGDITIVSADVFQFDPVFIAYTTLETSGLQIHAAHITLNSQTYRFHVGRPYGISEGFYRGKKKAELRRVLTHEIGHALGLAHSMNAEAIMFPLILALPPELGADDVAGIKELYGNG